jgi:hypothetical protein
MLLSSWHRFSSLDYNKHEGLSTEFSHLNSDILLCGAVLSDPPKPLSFKGTP